MPDSDIAALARRFYDAYVANDRAFVEPMLADGFTFTSPQDDHLDRGDYFERCWPNTQVAALSIETLLAQDDEVVVRYSAILFSGKEFRNVEYLRFTGGRLAEVDVYFGRTLKEPPEG